MTTVEGVKAATNPQEALLAIAAALDALLQQGAAKPAEPWPWKITSEHHWPPLREDDDAVPVHVKPLEVEETDDEITVTLPPVTEEWREKRELLAVEAQFDEQLGDGGFKLTNAYAKGGPLWLYLGSSEGRDYILGLPLRMKREMVADVKAHHTQQECEEFARDVLKASTDEQQGAAAQISEENIINRSVTHG